MTNPPKPSEPVQTVDRIFNAYREVIQEYPTGNSPYSVLDAKAKAKSALLDLLLNLPELKDVEMPIGPRQAGKTYAFIGNRVKNDIRTALKHVFGADDGKKEG